MNLKRLMMAAGLALGTAVLAAPEADAAYTSVTTGNVNLRAGIGTGTPVIATIPAGEPVTVYTCPSGWCHVTWRGRTGYVYSTYLASANVVTPPYYSYAPNYAPSYVVPPAIFFGFDFDRDRRSYRRYRDRDWWRNNWRGSNNNWWWRDNDRRRMNRVERRLDRYAEKDQRRILNENLRRMK